MNKTDSDFKVAHLMILDEIFKNRFFQIPDYQRGYAWEREQREDLFHDIEYLLNEDYTHFTGTLVASKVENNIYEIVDGQQRLTTLVIIIHECLHRDIPPSLYEILFNTYSKIGEIGNEKQKFITNRETRNYFDTTIIDNDCKTLQPTINSHDNILNAKKEVNKWLDKQSDIEKLIEVVCTKLGFIFYTPSRSKEIGIMFEVINNRGKPLSQLEKIKNFLIYYATKTGLTNLHEAVNTKWGIILQNLSKADKSNSEDETNFLRYCWVVYFDKGKKKSYDVYSELKARFPLDKNTYNNKEQNFLYLNGFLEFLLLSSKNYAYYFNNSEASTLSDDTYKSLFKSLRSQNIYASIMPLVLAVMSKAQHVEQNNLLTLIEKLNFRVYVLPNITNRADSGQGDLFNFAHTYFHSYDEYNQKEYREIVKDEEISYANITDWLIHKLKIFIDDYCPPENIKRALEGQDDRFDFYKWRGLRFFLMSYEEEINKKKTIDIERILLGRQDKKINDYYSIEHFWAIKNRDRKGLNDREKDHILKRRLGNFGLLEMGINIQAGDKPLRKKLSIYFGNNNDRDNSDLKQIAEVKDIFEPLLEEYKGLKKSKDSYYYSLYEKFINLQEEKFIEFALKRWSIQ